ncbi:MAG: chemotaxis protein CheA [Ferrovum sp.]|nr:chemotaxis protein CheA [Ferrovum sp.]NDU87473.1 chemotaxis protein CheA [Ferrovum sp.]
MTFDLSQFFQVFFEETEEHLVAMETLLLGLDMANPASEDLDAIFRAAHSIKGGSATFGFSDMTEVTHVLENLLDRLRKHEMALTEQQVNAFLEAGDVLRMQLAAHRGQGEVDPIAVQSIQGKLAVLATRGDVPATNLAGQGKGVAPIRSTEKAAEDQPGEDPGYGFFDDSPQDATLSSHSDHIDPGYGFFEDPVVEKQGEDPGYGFFMEISPASVKEEPVPVAVPAHTISPPAAERNPGRRAADHGGGDTSIRVGVEKVDQLINLVSELVITQAMLMQASSELDGAHYEMLQAALRQLERNSRDLQEAVMSVRMLPISFVFSRFPRLVRDLSGKLGKQVELKLLGESTELDKGLIEKISDPLTHLIRNSMDHGIELPEKRLALGKPAMGTVTLNAFHQGGAVVIEVADDGAGLNRRRILDKALERGLPCHQGMTDSEVWGLIFEAGFSTAEVVTDVSGRGVGMDVVKRNIALLGGRIELDSAEGLGTRMTIRLPLTLAILDGLLVSVGDQVYVFPLTSIVESLQIVPTDIHTVSGDGRLLRVRGEYLPVVYLRKRFVLDQETEGPLSLVVIIEADQRKVAVCVDALLGQQQVVIKSLETHFRKLEGISGATILGDGRVALIIDPSVLVQETVAQLKAVA